MTPDQWAKQVPPPGATRHAISIEFMRRVFFTDTAKWNGFTWQEVGCTHAYSTPLDQEPYFRESKWTGVYGAGDGGAIYSNRRYKGD